MKHHHEIRVLLLAAVALLVLSAVTPIATLAESRGKSLKRAEAELRKGNFAEAEKVYRHLIAQDQEDNEARLGLSFALMKLGNFALSYEESARVVAADPMNSRGHALMGNALLRSGEFRQSIESLYTALKFNNRESLGWAGLAEVAYFENDTRNAYEGFRRAIMLSPMEPDNYVSLARTCSRLEFYLEAASSYEKFLEVAPKTDAERRARIRGLIDFYRYLGTTKIHRLGGQVNATIPFELIQNRPFLNVMVNGKGPLRFVIDTGASLSVISDKAAQKLGIKPVARGGMARAVGGSGTFAIVYGLLDSFEIGPVKVETVPVYIRTVHSAADTPEEERADGYIGLSVLANYSVTINYQTKSLVLDRTPVERDVQQLASLATRVSDSQVVVPNAPGSGVPASVSPGIPSATDTAARSPQAMIPGVPSENTAGVATQVPPARTANSGIEIPIRSTSGGLASAETHLPGMTRALNFIIDTGATVTVVSKAAVNRFDLQSLKIKGETYRVIGAAGIEEGAEALGLATLEVSGLRKSNSRALILDLDPVNETSGFEQHGILGGDYLRHFLVQLDLRRFRLKLTPQTPAITVASDK